MRALLLLAGLLAAAAAQGPGDGLFATSESSVLSAETAPSAQTSGLAAAPSAPAAPTSVQAAAPVGSSDGVVTPFETHRVELAPPASTTLAGAAVGFPASGGVMTPFETQNVELAPPADITLGAAGGFPTSGGITTPAETHQVALAPPVSTTTTLAGAAGGFPNSGGITTPAETHQVALAPPVSTTTTLAGAAGGLLTSGGIMTSVETHKVELAPPASIAQNSVTLGATGDAGTVGGTTTLDTHKLEPAPPVSLAQTSTSIASVAGGAASSTGYLITPGGIATLIDTHKMEPAPPAIAAHQSASQGTSGSSYTNPLGSGPAASPAGPFSHQPSSAESSSDVTSTTGSSTSSLFPVPSSATPAVLYFPVRKVPYFPSLTVAYREAFPYLTQARDPMGYPSTGVGLGSQTAVGLFRYLNLLDYPYRVLSPGFYPGTPFPYPYPYRSPVYRPPAVYRRYGAADSPKSYYVIDLAPAQQISAQSVHYKLPLHRVHDSLKVRVAFLSAPAPAPAALSGRVLLVRQDDQPAATGDLGTATGEYPGTHPLTPAGESAKRTPLGQRRPTLEVHTPSGLHLPLTYNSDFVLHRK